MPAAPSRAADTEKHIHAIGKRKGFFSLSEKLKGFEGLQGKGRRSKGSKGGGEGLGGGGRGKPRGTEGGTEGTGEGNAPARDVLTRDARETRIGSVVNEKETVRSETILGKKTIGKPRVENEKKGVGGEKGGCGGVKIVVACPGLLAQYSRVRTTYGCNYLWNFL